MIAEVSDQIAEAGDQIAEAGDQIDEAAAHALPAESVSQVARLFAEAASVLFITGAGISAEAGLPTYRGVGGLYEKAVTDEGLPIEVALSGPMFARRPEITWRYLSALERACRGVAPSAAHRALADLERRSPRAWLLTQNVDGLHLAAGSKNVIEIHGNIHRMRCAACGYRGASPDPAPAAAENDAVTRWDPPCPRCGRPLRPDVVLFEEELPRAAVATFEHEWRRGFDMVFVIGTTAAFPYISQPVMIAAREGVPTVEINPGESDVSHFVAFRFQTTAGAALRAISRHLA